MLKLNLVTGCYSNEIDIWTDGYRFGNSTARTKVRCKTDHL